MAPLAQGSKAGSGLLKASGASGSVLHKGILATGKFLRYSFKPWQAVNLAKTIGNVAKVLGPVLSVITVAIEVANAYQESQQEQQLADARRSVVTDFQKMAEGLEAQFHAQCREVETALHDKLEADIRAARGQEEAAIASSNTQVARLSEMRTELETLLEEVAQESAVTA